jgi:hypothetical protein
MPINFMRSISSQFNEVFWNLLSGLGTLMGPILVSITVSISFSAVTPGITFNKYPFIGLNILVLGL